MDFEIPTGGGHGGPPSHGGKSPLKNKHIWIYAGVGAGLLALFHYIKNSGSQGATSTVDPTTGVDTSGTSVSYPNPSNSTDVQSQLDNFSSLIGSQVDTQIQAGLTQLQANNTQANTDLNNQITTLTHQNTDLNKAVTDLGQKDQSLIDAQKKQFQTQLDAITKQNSALNSQLHQIETQHVPTPSTPTPSHTPTPVVYKAYGTDSANSSLWGLSKMFLQNHGGVSNPSNSQIQSQVNKVAKLNNIKNTSVIKKGVSLKMN